MATRTKHRTQQKPIRVRFSDAEAEFLLEHNLARLATVSTEAEPHVVPVAYAFDGIYLYIGGWNLSKTLKFRQIQENNRVALVIDEWTESQPWQSRGIEIRGDAEIFECDGSTCIRVEPMKKASWGISEGE